MTLSPAARLLPGLALALAVAVAARALAAVVPVGDVAIAVLAGLLLANVAPLGGSFGPGLIFAVRRLLRAGIVLLGAQLSFAAVLAAGVGAIGLVIVLVVGTLAAMVGAARVTGLDVRLGLLLAVGTAICGNTAILATAPIIGARDRDVSIAIGVITLFGTAAVFVYPVVGTALGLAPASYGTWAGTAVNDTSQVVATGFAYGEQAGEAATIVKLMRNTMLAPVLVVVALWWSNRSPDPTHRFASTLPRLRHAVPLFVLAFVGMAMANSLGAFDLIRAGVDVAELLADGGRFLIVVALAAVGLSTRLAPMREVGLFPIYFGFAGSVGLALVSLATIRLVGI